MFSCTICTRLVDLSSCSWYRWSMGSVDLYTLSLSLNYFSYFSRLMAVIGIFDVIISFVCLFMDECPLIYCWAFVWGLATAAMRPLAGESVFGLIERTGNFCPALALLWLSTGHQFGYYLVVSTIMLVVLAISGFIFRVTGMLND